jgi:hypothetical protein
MNQRPIGLSTTTICYQYHNRFLLGMMTTQKSLFFAKVQRKSEYDKYSDHIFGIHFADRIIYHHKKTR